MILYCAVVLVILANDNEAKPHRPSTTTAQGQTKPIRPSPINTGELARLIHKINEDDYADNFENADYGDKHIDGKLYGHPQALDLDYFDIRGNMKTSKTAVMKLIQKNYLANQAHSQGDDYRIRVHVIKNPQVLEQFRKNLRKKQATSSSSDDDSDYNLGIERLLRRNAIFRLGAKMDGIDTNQNPQFALRNGEDEEFNYQQKSRNDNDKIIHFEPNDEKMRDKKMVVTFESSKHNDHDDKKRSGDKSNRQKDNYNEIASKKDDWELITKNNWNESDKKKNSHNNDYNDKDSYKKKDSYKDDYKQNDKRNDDNKHNDKYNDDYNKKDKYNDNYKKKDKYNDDYKKKDKYNDDYKKNDKYNDDYKNKDSYKKDPKKIDKYDDYDKNWNDKDLKKRSKSEKKQDDWDKPSDSKTVKKDTWEKQDKGDNWDNTVKKQTVGIASYEIKPKNDWKEKDDIKEDKTFKMSTASNEWDRGGGGNNKKFVPKISNYYNPRPRIHENAERAAYKAFGRTSIPFVGKKGIYED